MTDKEVRETDDGSKEDIRGISKPRQVSKEDRQGIKETHKEVRKTVGNIQVIGIVLFCFVMPAMFNKIPA